MTTPSTGQLYSATAAEWEAAIWNHCVRLHSFTKPASVLQRIQSLNSGSWKKTLQTCLDKCLKTMPWKLQNHSSSSSWWRSTGTHAKPAQRNFQVNTTYKKRWVRNFTRNVNIQTDSFWYHICLGLPENTRWSAFSSSFLFITTSKHLSPHACRNTAVPLTATFYQSYQISDQKFWRWHLASH